MRRKKRERELFDLPTPQPRLSKGETVEVYDAVLRLRGQGLAVFRLGRDKHLVRKPTSRRGRKLTTPQLVELAAQ